MGFRENFNAMITNSRGGIGKWIVVRHFSTTRSEYWNEQTKEAVGGPPFTYTDTVALGAKQLAFEGGRPSQSVGVNILPLSKAVLETYRYFVPSDVTIEEDDEIFDLDHTGTTPPTAVNYTGVGTGAVVQQRFKVKFVHEYIAANRGDLGYKLVIVERSYVP